MKLLYKILVATNISKQALAIRKAIPAFLLAALALQLGVQSAGAQAARFQFVTVRSTVAVGTTNTSIFTGVDTNSTIVLVNGATNANYSLIGLPAGVSGLTTDGAGSPVASTGGGFALQVRVNSTNLAEGIYKFYLVVDGLDTNGLPYTNRFPFVLQSARMWKGNGAGAASFGVNGNFSSSANWIGGVPSVGNDAVFTEVGAQTNLFSSGLSFTNISVTANATVGSLRFANKAFTDATATNATYHTFLLSPGVTLSVTGTNGFSILRDYIGEFGYSPDSGMGITFAGTNGALFVSNKEALFGINVGQAVHPTLNMSNLSTFVLYANRVGFSDYQLYPNYREINDGYNAGRSSDNYSGYPRRQWNNVYLARTNFITALYRDPANYTNDLTRGYGIMLQNNEQQGNGSSVNTFFTLGVSNVFYADSVCLVGGNSASGNTGGVKFGIPRFSTAIFRGTNGGRMSVFTISDGGGTNGAFSNIKATVDFTGNTNYAEIIADRFYIARDRSLIQSNQSPNIQGDLTLGYSTVDVNTAVLGCQEHSNKVDWVAQGWSPYLNYCQGRLILTNGSATGQFGATFRVNGTLTLGLTADSNPVGSAQQYNTFGRITIHSNATLLANNIVCDGGLNYYDSNGRQNTITINRGGTLVISNTIGANNLGANNFTAADPAGMYLDSLTISSGTLSMFVNPSRTNVFTRTISTPGSTPGIIRVAALTGVSSYPAQIPIIAYQGSVSPFLSADMSALGAGFYGYIINNSANQTIDLFVTTNPPSNLVWKGQTDNNWDTSTTNFVTLVGSVPAKFSTGDQVLFDDSTAVTNVNVAVTVVPSQTGVGMTISNNLNPYFFSGANIAGTAQILKVGTNSVDFANTEQGPITVQAGSVTGSGGLGTTLLWTNTALNFSGIINGSLTSTGVVSLASSAVVGGGISVQGGYLANNGTINVPQGSSFLMAVGVVVTNFNGATINSGTAPVSAGGDWQVPVGSTLANFGTINLWQNRILVSGALFGNGTIQNPNGGGRGASSSVGYVRVQQGGIISAGNSLVNDVSSMNMYCRFDWQNDPTASGNGYLPGILRVDVDFSNPQTNDFFNCDYWNNVTGILLMTNINTGAGVFANGQNFSILKNSSGNPTNFIDTAGFCPTIQPFLPGPGLVWGVTNFNVYGSIAVTTNSMVWDGTATATWITNNPAETAWKTGQAFADSLGALFDDSASGSTAITLSGTLSPAGITAPPISNNPTIFPGVVVSNNVKNYVLAGAGKISGPTSLYKTGPGTLTLLTSNDFTGNIFLERGTLAVSNNGALTAITALGVTGGGQMKNQLEFSGGTLNYVGTTNVNLQNYTVFNAGGGTINVASPTNILRLTRSPVGPGTITKTGLGTLLIDQGNATYGAGGITSPALTGGVTVNAGFLRLGVSSGGLGSGTLTLNGGGLLTTNFSLILTNTVNVTAASTVVVQPGCTNVLTGPLLGTGALTFTNNSVGTFAFVSDISAYSGLMSFGGTSANYLFNNATNANPCTGSALASFDLGSGGNTLSNYNGAGLTYNLGSLSGGANTILAGRATNNLGATAASTYAIGANGTTTTFAGRIQNGQGDVVSVVKLGAGRLFLNGVSTYTGSTTISNGVLSGNGSIASPFTMTAAATLAPGATASSIGTFTISNNATLAGSTIMKLNQSLTPSNDVLAVTGTLNGGGSLIVTNIGGAIVGTPTFKLFSQPVSGFSSVTLPSLSSGFAWTNTLAANGSISVVALVNTAPTNIVSSVTGNTLTLSWPADRIGWRLQVQTNSLSVGLNTNWSTVVGSTTTNSMTFTINPNSGSVFYRMVYP